LSFHHNHVSQQARIRPRCNPQDDTADVQQELNMSSFVEQQNMLPEMRRGASINTAANYFADLNRVLRRLPYHVVDKITAVLVQAYEENRTVYLFGNGGSAALASHSACDLGKGTAVKGRRRFRVLSLTDNIPVMTAWANDARYEDIFAEQLRNFVEKGDIVLAISGSGNSPNILNGLKVARETGAYTIGLTGFQGGKMKDLCDLCLVVPSDNMQFIEDLHVCISHSIFTAVRHQFANKKIAEAVPTIHAAQAYCAD
jgi:D-sedoheptulose 7-phosphate isomerase